MGQLDNIPPIRLPQFTPFPMEDAFRSVSDTFSITTPETPPNGVGNGDGDGDEPQDDDQRDDHPFAISARATEFAINGDAVQWSIKVLGGKYSTGDGEPFAVEGGDYPAVVLNENHHRSPGVGELPVETVVLLFVPTEFCNLGDEGAVKCTDGQYVRAITGGQVITFKYVPAVFPNRMLSSGLGPGFYVHLGTWTSRYAEQDSEGTPTRQNRVSVNQLVNEDVVLDAEPDASSEGVGGVCSLRPTLDRPTGYTEEDADTKGWVTWGHVNSVVFSNIAESYTLATGLKIYAKVTTNGEIPLRALSAEIDATTSTREDSGGSATSPPTTVYYLLGHVSGDGTEESPFHVFPAGCGNLQLSAVAIGFECELATEESPGGVKTNYQLRWDRD